MIVDRTAGLNANDLAGRVALIMGGGSVGPGWGIGKASAVGYAGSGAKVVVGDVRLDAAEETVELIRSRGGDAIALVVDVVDLESVRSTVDAAITAYGRVDILHNNVGIGKAGDFSLTSPSDWRRISDANLLSLHLATQAVLPSMKQHGRGVILTTSTIGSQRHIGLSHLAYGVTKAGANHFSRLIAVEYASFGIRANTIVVGTVDTPRIAVTLHSSYGGSVDEMREARRRQVPLGIIGDAWDVAHAAIFLASDKARFITGVELVIDGGLTATSRSS